MKGHLILLLVLLLGCHCVRDLQLTEKHYPFQCHIKPAWPLFLSVTSDLSSRSFKILGVDHNLYPVATTHGGMTSPPSHEPRKSVCLFSSFLSWNLAPSGVIFLAPVVGVRAGWRKRSLILPVSVQANISAVSLQIYVTRFLETIRGGLLAFTQARKNTLWVIGYKMPRCPPRSCWIPHP